MFLYFIFYKKDDLNEKFLSFFCVEKSFITEKYKEIKLHNCMMNFVSDKLPEISDEEYKLYKKFFKILLCIKFFKSNSDEVFKYRCLKSDKNNLTKTDLIALL